ncbi:MAG: hypothetical protein A2991_03980 [Candidatus Terrybacteria bacterium RIFCSPLOWO2_01_FULL_58_14]|uniref:Uncharacterized protein n=1 Tax=Candidatus Terrybacteria bacterium RIFCSPLOWO2_01_FULL_58_14 TaxID=1802369 RepID=A0A1G2PYV5_9BACT|nr:MAG: hypothetical protein A2991_03980 [Candidatus Terrybacteria bacterium RIFCSPLOWO2_01_FULL_58_14]
MAKFSKKHIFIFLVLAFIVVVLALVFSRAPLFAGTPRYAAVYLDTGDLYFGKLTLLPKFTLTDAWLIQPGPEEGTTSIARFSDAAWKPAGVINFERDHVVFWAPIAEGSQMIDAIEGRIQQPPAGSAAPSGNGLTPNLDDSSPTIPEEE